MGNSEAKPLPLSFPIAIGFDPTLALPRDVLLLILSHVSTLSDLASCMRVCRLFYNYCNRDESWLALLRLKAEAEFPGRTSWTGYQLKPIFLEPEWTAFCSEAVTLGPVMKRRELFQSKKVIRLRFDLYSGWGSLLLNHFIEGFFVNGSVVMGTLYDMLCEKPCIVYSGFLYKGKRHGGLGVSYYPDGSVCYKGPWVMDEQHGVGKTFWKNGSLQYQGHFQHGKKEGVGVQHWATGTYEGEWANDMPHGNGCWSWKDGAKFVGTMRDGKRHGFGILFYAETRQSWESKPAACVEYEGMWSDDLLNGRAKHFAKNGTLRFEGDFVCGLKQGSGRSYKKSGELCYEGEYLAGKKHGCGRLYAAGALVYEGEFVKGLFHGTGRLEGEQSCEFRGGHAVSSSSLDESFNRALADTSDDEATAQS